VFVAELAVFTNVTGLLSSDAVIEGVDTALILDGGSFGAWRVIGGGLFLPPGGLLPPGTAPFDGKVDTGVTISSGLVTCGCEAASAGSVDRGLVTVGVCEDFRMFRG